MNDNLEASPQEMTNVPDGTVLSPLLARVCRSHHWIKRDGRPVHVDAPLTDADVLNHLNGGYPRGVCPITPGESTTRCALLDMDSHKGEVPWADMVAHAQRIIDALRETGIEPTPFRSSGGSGIHLIMLWGEPQDAYSVREAMKVALAKCGFVNGTGGVVKGEIEIFPKQDFVPATGCGSMFILPLAGKSEAL